MRGNNFYNVIVSCLLQVCHRHTYTAASFLNLYNVCVIALIPVVVFPLLSRLTSLFSVLIEQLLDWKVTFFSEVVLLLRFDLVAQ
jgi:hypothetical protein